MENLPDPIEKRKEKIKIWLKDPHNLIFLGILLFATVLRLYYFSLTKNQPLWWDEADYLAFAKNLAGFPVNWIVTPEHISLSSFIAAFFFKFGASEAVAKFLLQIVPSIATVVLTYLISIEMYKDKRIGLIAAFLMAVFWQHLFNTMRFHVGVPGLFTGFLAIYVFWKGYENREKIFGKINCKWAIPLSVVLVLITYGIRRGYFLFGVYFLIYMLLTRNWGKLIKDKYNWIGLVTAAVLFILIEKLIFSAAKIEEYYGTYVHPETPLSLGTLKIFNAFFDTISATPNILTYLFWIGFMILSFNIVMSLGYIKKSPRHKEIKSDLFNIISILVTLSFFIFILRPDKYGFGDPRWYLSLVLSAFICIGKATTKLADFLKPYGKKLSIFFIIILMLFAGYDQVKHGGATIESKITSYEGTRQAGLMLKEISTPDDLIITLGQPQIEYYSERNTLHPKIWPGGEEQGYPLELTLNKIRETPNVKFYLVIFSEANYPDWARRAQQTNEGLIWEIPFMDTKINLATGQQEIKQSKKFEDITFTLIDIKEGVFIYRIDRESTLQLSS